MGKEKKKLFYFLFVKNKINIKKKEEMFFEDAKMLFFFLKTKKNGLNADRKN